MSQTRWAATVLASLFATTLAIAHAWNPPSPKPFVPIADSAVPRAIAGYSVLKNAPNSVTQKAREILSTASIIARTYAPADSGNTPTKEPIEFVLVGGTDRDALHDPRSCLIGSGWAIESDFSAPLVIEGKQVAAHACRIVNPSLPDKPAYDMLYIYVVDGAVIESATQIRAQLLLGGLIGKTNTPVYYLRFLRRVDGEDAKGMRSPKELSQFAAAMWESLKLAD